MAKPETTDNVLAYRVGQLEKVVADGFRETNKKLDELQGFVTKVEADKIIISERERADATHNALAVKIEENTTDITSLLEWKEKILTKISAGAIGILVLMVLAAYGIEKLL